MAISLHSVLALSAIGMTLVPVSYSFVNAEVKTPATLFAASMQEENDPISTLFSYPHEGRTATTLYLNQLPVLTFLEAVEPSEEIAQTVSDRINQLVADADFDATKFTVRWTAPQTYELRYADETVVNLGEEIYLADTTGNEEQDALIAVNRIRRITGAAEPLTVIANLPEKPKPKPVVAAAPQPRVTRTLRGGASWYGPGFHGRLTANGERYNQYGLTAAHKTLPFGTRVRVTNNRNGRSVIVRINDRGPYAHGRIIDLSRGAAQQIGMISSGVATVTVEVLN